MPLSRHVGTQGHVTATDIDSVQLAALREFVAAEGLVNVSATQDDVYHPGLSPAVFDFLHVRYVFAPLGRPRELISSLMSLCRAGGIVAAQEPITSTWACYPKSQPWGELKDLILRAFSARGGNFDAGEMLPGLFRDSGLQDVRARAEVLCPAPEDP